MGKADLLVVLNSRHHTSFFIGGPSIHVYSRSLWYELCVRLYESLNHSTQRPEVAAIGDCIPKVFGVRQLYESNKPDLMLCFPFLLDPIVLSYKCFVGYYDSS